MRILLARCAGEDGTVSVSSEFLRRFFCERERERDTHAYAYIICNRQMGVVHAGRY